MNTDNLASISQDLKALCTAFLRELHNSNIQATFAVAFLIDVGADTKVISTLHDLLPEQQHYMAQVAQSAVQQQSMPPNVAELEGFCTSLSQHFECTYSIILVLFEQHRAVWSYVQCDDELFRAIMEQIVVSYQNGLQN